MAVNINEFLLTFEKERAHDAELLVLAVDITAMAACSVTIEGCCSRQ